MSSRPTKTTIDALHHTLAQVEEQAGLAPDDVCLIELKRILLNRVAELEASELAAATPKDQLPVQVDLLDSPADQPAVAVAVDLAITLLTDYLSPRPLEPVGAVLPAPDGTGLPDGKNRR